MKQNICKNVLEPSTSCGYAVDVKMLYKYFLHVTTSYLQHVLNMLKHLQNICKNVLEPSTSIFLQMFYFNTSLSLMSTNFKGDFQVLRQSIINFYSSLQTMVAVSLSSDALVSIKEVDLSINEVDLRRTQLVLGWADR